jgi:hypothetical protein
MHTEIYDSYSNGYYGRPIKFYLDHIDIVTNELKEKRYQEASEFILKHKKAKEICNEKRSTNI